MNQLEVLTLLQDSLEKIPIIPYVFYAALILWGIFSIILAYHWISYARKPLISASVITAYVFVSLFIIGLILNKIYGIYI